RKPVEDAPREHTFVTDITDDRRRVRVTTERGDIEADVAVVCPGPWSAKLIGIETFATLEHVAYFRTGDGALPPTPIFIEFADPAVYGLPTSAVGAYKLALHHGGRRVDPDCVSLDPRPEEVDAIVRA